MEVYVEYDTLYYFRVVVGDRKSEYTSYRGIACLPDENDPTSGYFAITAYNESAHLPANAVMRYSLCPTDETREL